MSDSPGSAGAPRGGVPLAPREPAESRRAWERELLFPALQRAPERRAVFRDGSGREVPRVVSPRGLAGRGYDEALGDPGEAPFTRGVRAEPYAETPGRFPLGTGAGLPAEANARARRWVSEGGTSLYLCFDEATTRGLDSDAAREEGEVGHGGVPIDRVADMEAVLDGVPLDKVRVFLGEAAPASVLWAMYLVVAEERGVPWNALRGASELDPLNRWCRRRRPRLHLRGSLRLAIDMAEFGLAQVPGWIPMMGCGHQIRDAGADAVQELAFSLISAWSYLERGAARGRTVEEMTRSLALSLASHLDFFEEMAKLRAARRIWARELRRRFGVRDEEALRLRVHCRTAPSALTAEQPVNNVVRQAWQALSAMMGGAETVYISAHDALSSHPDRESLELALRAGQILHHETGVAELCDPLGGGYYLEWLTDRIEEEAMGIAREVEEMGGYLEAITSGYPQVLVGEARARREARLASGEEVRVGVTKYADEPAIGPAAGAARSGGVYARQCGALAAYRAVRNRPGVARSLEALRLSARGPGNLMPAILDCVRAGVTLGEVMQGLQEGIGAP